MPTSPLVFGQPFEPRFRRVRLEDYRALVDNDGRAVWQKAYLLKFECEMFIVVEPQRRLIFKPRPQEEKHIPLGNFR